LAIEETLRVWREALTATGQSWAPKTPSSHDDPSGEGVTVVAPGIINFNHTGGGENIYVQTS
jgi:hypothetical protein